MRVYYVELHTVWPDGEYTHHGSAMGSYVWQFGAWRDPAEQEAFVNEYLQFRQEYLDYIIPAEEEEVAGGYEILQPNETDIGDELREILERALPFFKKFINEDQRQLLDLLSSPNHDSEMVLFNVWYLLEGTRLDNDDNNLERATTTHVRLSSFIVHTPDY